MGKSVLSRARRKPDVSRGCVFPRGPMPLHAMITSAGLTRQRTGDYHWHGQHRGPAEFAILQWTLAGRGRLRFEDQHHEITPGDVMLVTIPHDHEYWFDPEIADRWHFFYLCLNGRAVMQAFHAAIAQAGPMLRDVPEDSPLARIATEACLDVTSQRIATPWQASSAAYALAMAIMDHTTPHQPGGDEPRRPEPIRDAIQFARDHLEEDITVDDLADAAGYSRYHFSRLFRESENVSPAAFLQGERLRKAARLLHTTDEPIKTIAFACGFTSPNYFAKAFKRSFGVTPGQMRQSGMF